MYKAGVTVYERGTAPQRLSNQETPDNGTVAVGGREDRILYHHMPAPN